MRGLAWTDEQQATLVRMAGEGSRARDIAKALGTTRSAIIGRCARTGVPLIYRSPAASPRPPRPRREKVRRYGPEAIARVRQLYLDGVLLREIEAQTGVPLANYHYMLKDLPRRRSGVITNVRYDINTKIAACCAHLTGEPQRKVCARFGMGEKSLLRWLSKPEVRAPAEALANRVKARWAVEAEQARCAEAEAAEAECRRIAEVNAPIFAQMSLRHKHMLLRRVAGETLEAVAQDYGITRERVRQIEVKWRLLGLVVPGTSPITEASKRAVTYVSNGRRPGRPATKPRATVDFWSAAHALVERETPRKRQPYKLSDEERQRRAERMRGMQARRHAAEAGA